MDARDQQSRACPPARGQRDSLNLVETTARGAPAIQNTTNKGKARSLVVPHIALEDTILADEVQNVRAFGSESMLEGVQAVVNQRMSEMATKMDATLEHLRIGAIKGQILDADGSAVIYDLFTQFGVTAHSEIDFGLDNASPALV
jgi:Phage major capsid protein E